MISRKKRGDGISEDIEGVVSEIRKVHVNGLLLNKEAPLLFDRSHGLVNDGLLTRKDNEIFCDSHLRRGDPDRRN